MRILVKKVNANDKEEHTMKNTSAALNICLKVCSTLLLIALVLILVLFISWHTAQAQNEPVKTNGNDVKQYLIEKYNLSKDGVTSTVQQTPNGPSGKLRIHGKIVSKAEIVGTDKKERSRAIAKAFLEEESDLFDITNMEEVREIWIDTFKSPYTNLTTTNIHYRRYINDLELKDMYIQITIGPDENIRSVNSELVSVPPELYQAVTKKTLSEAEIRKIVEDNIKTNPAAEVTFKEIDGSKSMMLKKLVTPSPPYIVWEVDSVWKYIIDAFTGEIIKKIDRVRYIR